MLAKAPLLEAVETLNNDFDTNLRVKSKSTAVIVQTLNATLESIDPLKLFTEADPEMMDTFATYDVDLPEAPSKKEIKKYKKQQKKAEGMSAEVVVNDDEDAVDNSSEEPEEEEEPEVDEARQKLEKAVHKLQTKLNSGTLKKKKAKKLQKKYDALVEELDATAETDKPVHKKKKKPAGEARVAREDRPIAEYKPLKEGTITFTIVKFLAKKPRTIQEVINHLAKKFPERPVSGMTKTVGMFLGGKGTPLPLHYMKGIPCVVENDGTPEKTIKVDMNFG